MDVPGRVRHRGILTGATPGNVKHVTSRFPKRRLVMLKPPRRGQESRERSLSVSAENNRLKLKVEQGIGDLAARKLQQNSEQQPQKKWG